MRFKQCLNNVALLQMFNSYFSLLLKYNFDRAFSSNLFKW